jgi:hypothetical protein
MSESSLWFASALLAEGWTQDVRLELKQGRIDMIQTAAKAHPGDSRHEIGLPGLPNVQFQRWTAIGASWRPAASRSRVFRTRGWAARRTACGRSPKTRCACCSRPPQDQPRRRRVSRTGLPCGRGRHRGGLGLQRADRRGGGTEAVRILPAIDPSSSQCPCGQGRRQARQQIVARHRAVLERVLSRPHGTDRGAPSRRHKRRGWVRLCRQTDQGLVNLMRPGSTV